MQSKKICFRFILQLLTCLVGHISYLVGTTLAQTGSQSNYLKTIKTFYLAIIGKAIGFVAFYHCSHSIYRKYKVRKLISRALKVLGKVKFILESKIPWHFLIRRSGILFGNLQIPILILTSHISQYFPEYVMFQNIFVKFF